MRTMRGTLMFGAPAFGLRLASLHYARASTLAPFRSAPSYAHFRGDFLSTARLLVIGPVVQARDPEDDADEKEELEHGERHDFRREAERGRERVHRRVAHDAVDVPVLAEPGPDIAHESHEPGEGDRDEDQHVLRDRRDLPPAHLAGPLRAAEEEDVDRGDRDHREQHRADL